MKPLRIYSIQTQISLIFLLIVIVVTFSSMLSIYFSQRYLVSARLVAGSLIPRIQRAKDIQTTATEVSGYSWRLSNTNSQRALQQTFAHLTIALARLGKLTSTLSNEDSGIDIVSLNFLSQAVQSHTQLIFQVKAQLLKQEAEQLKIAKGLHRDLLKAGVNFLETHSHTKKKHSVVHEFIEQCLGILEKFDTPSLSLADVKQLGKEFAKIKNMTILPAVETKFKEKEKDRLLDSIQTPMEQLLKLKQNSLSIAMNINHFNKTQNELSDKLTLLIKQYIDRVSEDSLKNMELLLKREEQAVFLTLGVLISSLVLLYLFHRQSLSGDSESA
jgi:hypothetical protein